MPRRPRHYLPGYSYHLVQRGINRARTFFDRGDCELYLALWRKYGELHQLKVHVYCLMPNHIHFLVTPGAKDSISKVTRVVGSTYASFINHKYSRTGTLWEGRHRASLVDSDRYILACYRYIEMNPVRARLVQHPCQYQWSSYALNSRAQAGWLTPHPSYIGLATSDDDRMTVYRSLLGQTLTELELAKVRTTLASCTPLADQERIEAIEARHGIRFGSTRRGRPGQMKPPATPPSPLAQKIFPPSPF